jgi:hypothetical protein
VGLDPGLRKDSGEQGDQIGRTFAYWVILVVVLKIAEVGRQNYCSTCVDGRSYVILMREKTNRAIFWAIFSQTHLVILRSRGELDHELLSFHLDVIRLWCVHRYQRLSLSCGRFFVPG